MIKKAILGLFDTLGYELRPRGGRGSLAGVLRHAGGVGLVPATVIDVGAAYGDFTRTCSTVFRQARFLMIEPLDEYGPHLAEICRTVPNATIAAVAATSEAGERTINVHPDLVGSSFYRENEDSDVNGAPRQVRAETLDGLAEDTGAQPPFLVKIDVQGAELDVLEGAGSVLAESQFVVLEVSFFRFFEGAPLFHDVVSYMNSKGFVVYEVFGMSYRPLDGALAQADVVFIPEGGAFRAHHHYATRTQREAMNRRLQVKR